MDINELKNLVDKKLSIRQISKLKGLSFSSVKYWINKYGFKTSGFKPAANWDKENLLNIIEKSECKSDVLKLMNLTISAGNFKTLKKYLKIYNIDETKIEYKYNRGNRFKKKYSDEEVFCKNSKFSCNLKERILKSNLKEYKCSVCGNEGEWMNKKMVLQVDHINGINNDNRIENIRFICPNCHSQTETFSIGDRKKRKKKENFCSCGKKIYKTSKRCVFCENIKREKEISESFYNKLKEEITQANYSIVGRKHNVSGNTIKSWIKKYEIAS